VRFVIGFAAPLTGPQSIVGLPMLEVVERAAHDARRTGPEIKVRALDDEADEAVAARIASELAEDSEVIAVVGHKNSGPSLAAAPVYASAGLAQLTQCSTDNALSRSGWTTFFRLCADNETQAHMAADFVHGRLGNGKVAVVHDGTDYGQPLAEAFVQRLQSLGGATVQMMAMTVGQADFSREAAAIRSFGADVVYIGATEIEGSKLTIALRETGATARVLTSEGGPHNLFPRLAGPAAEGTFHTYAGADPSASEASRRFVARCIEDFGDAPSFAVECHDAVAVVAAALGTGATTRDQVCGAIKRNVVDGLSGKIRFDRHGDRIDAPCSLWRVERGRMVPADNAVR
jgi:branched-chain amino acid transport system substrate-binding protein